MPELDADFEISTNNLEAEYEITQSEHFDCSFEILASGITSIIGSDLINAEQTNHIVLLTSKTFIFEQGIASDTWIINHNLNKKPSITIVDSADNVVEGAEKYIDENTIEIYFNGAFKGKAYLN